MNSSEQSDPDGLTVTRICQVFPACARLGKAAVRALARMLDKRNQDYSEYACDSPLALATAAKLCLVGCIYDLWPLDRLLLYWLLQEEHELFEQIAAECFHSKKPPQTYILGIADRRYIVLPSTPQRIIDTASGEVVEKLSPTTEAISYNLTKLLCDSFGLLYGAEENLHACLSDGFARGGSAR